MFLGRGKLPFASLSRSESWLRQQSSISPDAQKIHSNEIKILSNGHCLCRGPGASLCQVCPSCSCGGLCHTHCKSPGLGSFPQAPEEMLCCRTRGSRPSKHPTGMVGMRLPCPQSSKAVVCTAGPAFRHLHLFN